MTRKDYVLLAKALHSVRPPRTWLIYGEWESCVLSIASALAKDNERFDRERFVAACKA